MPEKSRLTKSHQVVSNVIVLLAVVVNYNCVVHRDFLSGGYKVNKGYDDELNPRLREATRKQRPDLWQNNSPTQHHDILAKNRTIIVAHTPYSPFPKLERLMKGWK